MSYKSIIDEITNSSTMYEANQKTAMYAKQLADFKGSGINVDYDLANIYNNLGKTKLKGISLKTDYAPVSDKVKTQAQTDVGYNIKPDVAELNAETGRIPGIELKDTFNNLKSQVMEDALEQFRPRDSQFDFSCKFIGKPLPKVKVIIGGYNEVDPSSVSIVGNFFGGMGDAVNSNAEGLWNAATNPIDTARNLGNAIAHPVDTGKAIYNNIATSFEENVINGNADSRARFAGRAIGEAGVLVAGPKGLDKAVKAFRAGENAAEAATILAKGSSKAVANEAKGLIGKDFESFLANKLGGNGSFKAAGREFDGAVGNRWLEAKSGRYWEDIVSSEAGLAKFKSDIGSKLAIARQNGATLEVHSNTPIPSHVKAWLEQKGITYVEW